MALEAVVVGLVVLLPLLLVWRGRGRPGSARFARRYPHTAALMREAELTHEQEATA